MSAPPKAIAGWAKSWQRSWDSLEERYVPDREARIAAVLDVVERVVGTQPVVVDLGCGTGTVSLRLLERLPRAHVVAVDVDPILLSIASATFAADDRVSVVEADLRDARWASPVESLRIDAIVTVTALHWLAERTVRRLYGDVVKLLRPGGVFVHAEHMPLVDTPVLSAALSEPARRRAENPGADGAPTWDEWWESVADDPVLEPALSRRRAVFQSNYPLEEFSPPAEWHTTALRGAGFAEVGVIWRMGNGAIVAAIAPKADVGISP